MRQPPLVALIAGLTAIALFATPGRGTPPRAPLPEYLVKAAFLYHFVEFVDWPERSPLPRGTITIGVLGRDPFGDVLDKAVLGKTAAGRTLVIRRFASIETLEDCEILFVSASEMPHLPAVLARLRDAAVLTVGEGDKFARRGGMIGFFNEDNRVRLEVNRSASEKAGLRLSSKLLALARLVEADTAESRQGR